ncbi:MAG: hypothetical protein AAFZ17_02110 [Cyanobacteria bacterium J06650_10]
MHTLQEGAAYEKRESLDLPLRKVFSGETPRRRTALRNAHR